MSLLVTLGLGLSGSVGYEVISATPLIVDITVSKVRIVLEEAVDHSDATVRTDALNPSNYLFSGGLEGSHVVHVADDTTFDVFLVGPMTDGTVYTVKVINIETSGGNPPDPTDLHDTAEFTGIVAPVEPAEVLMARSVNARTLEIIFSEPVVVSDALNKANYSISPTLTVTGVQYISPTVYYIKTSRQTVGEVYSVTISDIADLE